APEPETAAVPEEAAAAAIVTATALAPVNSEDLQKAAAASAANAKKANRRLYLFEGIEAFDTYSAAQEKKRDLIADPNKVGPNGRTLLQKAAAQDDLDTITLLHESKADFNLADREGYTPLMYAARFAKRAETVAMLLSFGADIKAKNRFGLSAIEIAAADNKNAQITQALLPRSPALDSKKAFVAAVGMGRSNDTLQAFLDAGMNANEVYKGKTLLMYAAESNTDTDTIEFLLQKGADKTMLSNDWKDAYWFASQNPSLPHNDVYWSLNNKESD
ncbi:MAG: ankyrin repeat domain-containing protein, partial [Treponema sp.]|nr:ankyrin repeat domain-containing protein [Treponema sp.]